VVFYVIINLSAVQEAYKDGSLVLNSEYGKAVVAIAMIHSVLNTYQV